MLTIEGTRGETLVLDGGWVEKLQGGNSIARTPVSTFREAQVRETSTRRFVLFGERTALLHVAVVCATVLSLMVEAHRRAEVDAFVAAIERAKAEG